MSSGPTSGIAWLAPQSYETALSRFSSAELQQMDAEEQHDFPKPDRSATLWRYLETFKFEHLLKTRTLFLCQVEKLAKGEPNEGRLNSPQEQALIREYSADHVQLKNLQAFHERVRQRACVTCFSLNDFEEMHMWEEFCKESPNEGVAVRTTYEKLCLSMAEHPEPPKTIPYCAKVRYEESAYMVSKIGYLLFQKLPQFCNERELRVCHLSLEDEHPIESFRVPVHLSRLIQRVHVHPRASKAYYLKIRKLLEQRLPERSDKLRWSIFRQ